MDFYFFTLLVVLSVKPSGLRDFLQENALQFGAKLLGMKRVCACTGPPLWICFFQASHRVGSGEAVVRALGVPTLSP